MQRTTLNAARAGHTLLEAAVASAVLLVISFGAVSATQTFTDASKANSSELNGITNGGRAAQTIARELTNATVLDPKNDLEIFTPAGVRVADTSSGRPVAAVGAVFRLSKKAKLRLVQGEVVFDQEILEYKMDTADVNGDGRTDQIVRSRTAGGVTTHQILTSNAISLSFRKHGAVIAITTHTKGSVKQMDLVKGKKIPVHRHVKQRVIARPRNF